LSDDEEKRRAKNSVVCKQLEGRHCVLPAEAFGKNAAHAVVEKEFPGDLAVASLETQGRGLEVFGLHRRRSRQQRVGEIPADQTRDVMGSGIALAIYLHASNAILHYATIKS